MDLGLLVLQILILQKVVRRVILDPHLPKMLKLGVVDMEEPLIPLVLLVDQVVEEEVHILLQAIHLNLGVLVKIIQDQLNKVFRVVMDLRMKAEKEKVVAVVVPVVFTIPEVVVLEVHGDLQDLYLVDLMREAHPVNLLQVLLELLIPVVAVELLMQNPDKLGEPVVLVLLLLDIELEKLNFLS